MSRVIINDISNENIDLVLKSVSFDVTYTVNKLFSKKKFEINCQAEVLLNIKDCCDFYNMTNWCDLSSTVGYSKSKGIEIYIKALVRHKLNENVN